MALLVRLKLVKRDYSKPIMSSCLPEFIHFVMKTFSENPINFHLITIGGRINRRLIDNLFTWEREFIIFSVPSLNLIPFKRL